MNAKKENKILKARIKKARDTINENINDLAHSCNCNHTNMWVGQPTLPETNYYRPHIWANANYNPKTKSVRTRKRKPNIIVKLGICEGCKATTKIMKYRDKDGTKMLCVDCIACLNAVNELVK